MAQYLLVAGGSDCNLSNVFWEAQSKKDDPVDVLE